MGRHKRANKMRSSMTGVLKGNEEELKGNEKTSKGITESLKGDR